MRHLYWSLFFLGCVTGAIHAASDDTRHDPGYTMNFDNVPIKEFLKFISKVAGINIIYNEADLDFNVTIVSQEPTDLNNIISALVQVLRIHDLALIEEDRNLLIHKNDGVRQIPTVVSKESPFKGLIKPALMTKVFKIQQANPSHIASLITPMLSKDALVEVSMETRQLIITDNASSLATIDELLLSLDAPETPYNVEVFPIQTTQAKEIATLAKQILLPMAGSTPLELIPHPGNHAIYIVSTPFLIDKARQVLKELDIVQPLPEKVERSKVEGSKVEDHVDSVGAPKKQNKFFVYTIKYRTAEQLKTALNHLADYLKKSSGPNDPMVQTIHSMQLVPASNALLFTGSPETIQELSNILATLDTPGSPPTTAELAEMQPPPEKTEVFVYKLRYLSATDLQTMLHDIASHANANRPSAETKAFVNAVDTMRIIPEANAVQFVTTPEIISQIKELLVTLDISDNAKSQVQSSNGSNFLIYKVKNMNPEDLLSQVKQIVKASPHQDSLLKCVATAQYAASSNSLIFTGRKADLDKVQILLETLDEGQVPLPTKVTPSRRAEGYKLYRPQHIAGTELIARVRNFEQTLVASGVTDYSLAETVDHLAYIERTNVIVVTGTEADISQVMTLLQEFDTEGIAKKGPDIETIDDTGFLIYKLQHQGGAGIVGALSVISRDLNTQTAMKKNEGLIEAIRSTQWIEPTNSLIATGQPKVLSRLRELIESIDQPLKQVFIEVLVLETNNTSDFEFGLRWGSQGAVNNKFSWGSGNYSPLDSQSASSSGTTNTGFADSFNQITGTRTPTGSDIPPIEGGLFGVIGDIIWHQGKSYAALGSLLNAIRSDGNITVVLSQKIVAQDNQNAKIFSGSNIPFTGSLVTTSGLSQTTNANLEYRNIGVTLSLTPIIGDNDIITLDISHEISEVANEGGSDTNGQTTTTTTNMVNGIQTTKTSMQTRVHMPDRHFLILSGTMRNQATRNVAGIPCLGGLPLVGAAFSQSTRQTSTVNVVIFVKPQIIKSPLIYANITKAQQELYGSKEQANPEDFQKGIELIRSPEDIDEDDDL